ncbi:MAG: DUF5702 domain-containing protein [Acetatifactor sp.]|nr:DUF5702 domain-containing protein [Acetatifactor sp.]
MKKLFITQRIKVRRFLKKYVNGTKGIISILMCLLMLPFISIAGILINAARVNSAVAVFDEALCNASDSTLGTYDTFLRERFGLMAISQSGKSAGYTQAEFINDTFQMYMNENMKSLSNTYDTSMFNATGILPLSNMNVLQSAVFEASKYSVPTKFAMDGLFIEDLLSKLFGPLDGAAQWMDEISSAGQVAMDADTLNTRIEEACAAMHTLEEKIGTYQTAYGEFLSNSDSAVKTYNATVDTVKAAVEAAYGDYQTAQSNYSSKNSAVISAEHGRESLISQYNSVKNNADDLAAFMDEHGSEIQPWLDAVSERDAAATARDDAYSDYQDAVSSAQDTLSGPRATLTSKRDAYKQAVDDVISAIDDAKAAVEALKEAVKEFNDSCGELTKNSLTIGFNYAKDSYEDELDRLETERKNLLDEGQPEMAAERQKKIDEIKIEQNMYDNVDKAVEDQIDNTTEATDQLREIATQDFESLFDAVKANLSILSSDLESYPIPTDTSSKYSETGRPGSSITNWVISFDDLLAIISEAILTDILQRLEDDLNGSSAIDSLKMIAKFVLALLSAFNFFDYRLIGVADFTTFPSLHPTTWGDAKNPYDAEDQARYIENKEKLGAYGDGTEPVDEVVTIGQIIESIMNEIDRIDTAINDMHWYNFFSQICTIISAIVNICSLLFDLFTELLKCLKEYIIASIKTRLLVTGYCAYNLANRTTFTGTSLMGSSYAVPDLFDDTAYCATTFSGAEFEYIFAGTPSEVLNQTAVWGTMYLLRVANNVPFIFTDEEVDTLCTAVGPETFGIGAVVCWILYIIAESFVDMVILCGGGAVPVIKRPLFLTIKGIPNLITKLTHLSLSDPEKAGISNALKSGCTKNVKLTQDQVDSFGSGSATGALNFLSGLIELDYTKHMLLMVLLTIPNEVMMVRLADIIQLEANFYSSKNAGYKFDIGDAYTYLRVSGEFETNEFVRMSGMNEDYSYKIGDGGSPRTLVDRIFKSDERILYRGY